MRTPVNVNRVTAQMEADEASKGKEIIWSMFRCADMNCNTLLTEENHNLGYCGGCQGVRFGVARYLTKKEDRLIKQGKLRPHKVNLDVIGVEPPPPREVR
jgi:hypothetical protein